jgi:anti-sigma factor RsiW
MTSEDRTPRDIACQELVELVAEYFEGALPDDEVAAVDRHLMDCEACLRYLRQMRATITALGMVPSESVTETLSDQTVDALLAAFRHRR